MRQNRSSTRKADVTIVLLGVFLLGVANVWLFRGLARQAELLTELGITPDPLILMIGAAFWTIIFSASALLIWFRRPISRWLIPGTIALYAIYNWILLFGFMQSSVTRQGWGLDLILFLGAIILTAWILNRPGNRSYFIT